MKNSLLPKTAILLFAYSPEEELRRKPLWNGYSFIKELNRNTIRQIENSGLDYFHFSEKQQVGRNFGERFIHAIQAVFDKGYENIITLGNDTPQLRANHIAQAVDHLNRGEIVIGPSTDGGFYMLGLNKSQFKPDVLIRLPWQTAKLRRQLLEVLWTTNKNIHQLPVLMDLDSVNDIKRFASRAFIIPISILKYLSTIIRQVKSSSTAVKEVYTSIYLSAFFNKGSPLTTS